MPSSDQGQQLLAMVEAEVGSLLEFLPVPLLVTSAAGDILRSNTAAVGFLDTSETLVGKHIDDVLRRQAISARVRTLCHRGQVVRLFVLHHQSEQAVVCQH
jgi:hypothetical protein